MCGIVGYIGKKEAYPILINGLKKLEYRGYDSAGVALFSDRIRVYKHKGKVADLEKYADGKETNSALGIGHTRWATHGVPNDVNAHPHTTEQGDIVLVHNGIIENYVTLKLFLEKKGHVFLSETDTEVLAHLIEEIRKSGENDFPSVVHMALQKVTGAYAIAVLSLHDPDMLVVAKKGSPLVVGVGEKEFYVASDPYPLAEYTKQVIYLEDGEVAVLFRDGRIEIKTDIQEVKTPYIHTLDIELETLEKSGFEHFMQKEIHEQPRAVCDSLRGRLYSIEDAVLNLGGIQNIEERLLIANQYTFLGCGTSWHAGLIGKKIFEDLLRIPSRAEYASEFRYGNPIIGKNEVFFGISQSGETADTLAAIQCAKEGGGTVLGICNVVGSSIARAAHAGLYTHAGPEIGVASTKAFTTQIVTMLLLGLYIGQKKKIVDDEHIKKIMRELSDIPEKIEKILTTDDHIKNIAKKYRDAKNALYLGRGYGFPVALEGALKLKEISYIHAEGYPAAEMKHGPIALVDEFMPVVIIALEGSSYEKIMSNAEEIRARKGKIIAVVSEGDTRFQNIADDYIEIPKTEDLLSPLLSVIPLQLFAYHIAVFRGCDVDRPRNLAKSVTVE